MDIERYQQEVLEEIEDIVGWYNPLIRVGCTKVEFVSKSHGRNRSGPRKGKQRKRKHWKEVRLLRYDGGCFTIKNSPTGKLAGKLDWIVKEILEGVTIPLSMNPYQYFLKLYNEM